MANYQFSQIDVFSSTPHGGNPVAVVHGADHLTEVQMAAFAQWTNLSETTFLLTPTDPSADYRLRIFTPSEELPFAGHPTLGSATAWLTAGGVPRTPGYLVQECDAGLITVMLKDDSTLAFAAPPLARSGDVDADTLALARQALGLSSEQVTAANWIDNGPGWLGLVLTDATTVLSCVPDAALFTEHDLRIGVLGTREPHTQAEGSPADVEIRAFIHMAGAVREDPVTGSLNAGFASWLIPAGSAPEHYVAAQGTAVGRDGRVSINFDGQDIWVGGNTRVVIHGTVDF